MNIIKSTIIFSSLLSGYTQAMNPHEVQSLYRECTEGIDLDECIHLVQTAQAEDRIASRTTTNLLPISAPWRDSYKTAERAQDRATTQQPRDACPFCDQFSRPHNDQSNYILERNEHSVTMFNRDPYLPLHFLILPLRHIAQWNQLTPTERNELLERGATWLKKLKRLGVGGANFYFNLEHKSAGASLPGHVHGQLLSRWDGDRSAITYLLGRVLIRNERALSGLLPSFYDFARSDGESEGAEKLARVFGQFSRILRSTYNEPAAGNDDCYVCEVETQADDAAHLVVKRFQHWLIMVHRFGYACGHLRVTSRAHGTSMDRLGDEEREELAKVMNLSQLALKKIVRPDGLNMVINDGTCSDTPFENHVSCDIVPRIVNDTSSTAIICGRSVIQGDVDLLWKQFIEALESGDGACIAH